MAPKRKEIPFKDVTIKGLETFIAEGASQDEMAAYYTIVYKEKYSRRTVKRRINEMNKR